jgi:hypothetical protein
MAELNSFKKLFYFFAYITLFRFKYISGDLITLQEDFLLCSNKQTEINKESFCQLTNSVKCECYNSFIKNSNEYILFNTGTTHKVLFSNSSKLFETICKNISQIQIQGSPSDCFNDLPALFLFNNRYRMGYLTKVGIIRLDSYQIYCDENISYFRTLNNIHHLKKKRNITELITETEYNSYKRLYKRTVVETCFYNTISMLKFVKENIELELKKNNPDISRIYIFIGLGFLFSFLTFIFYFLFNIKKRCNKKIELECNYELAFKRPSIQNNE